MQEKPSSSTSVPNYGFDISHVAGPSRKCARLNFDDLDDDPGDPDQQGVEQEELHIPDEYFDALASEQGAQQIGMPKRRRLVVKTSPTKTGYPNTALMTRSGYKVSMEQRRIQVAAHKRERTVAARAAIRLLAAQPELAELGTDLNDHIEVVGGSCIESQVVNPHPSHDIQTLASEENIIWCWRCAAWSKNVKLKALAKPCHGLLNGSKTQLRPLQVGLVPRAGVRMPKHLSKTYARGRRR